MATFLEIATPLIGRGIPVIPVRPLSKRGLFEDQFETATTDINIVRQWNQENPSYNVGCVGKADKHLILDCDTPELVARIERETGHAMPPTFTVTSAGKGCPHFYFKQTEMSRAIGNKKSADLFDLQSMNKYVVGPGSVLDNGKSYEVIDDSPIADFPDWLARWILDHADQRHAKLDKAPSTHPDFDFDEFMEHYDLEYFGEGKNGKHILEVCPVKGSCHTSDGDPDYAACVIFYDGDKLGFSDLATSCEGSNLSIGGLIHYLNSHGYEPYEGVIWPKDTKSLLNDPRFLVEDASLNEEPVATAPTPTSIDDLDAALEAHVKEMNPEPLPVPDDIDAILFAAPAEGTEFDERALYGRLGEMARVPKLPLGWMYPALLARASALDIRDKDNNVRSSIYVANIAPVGFAKTVIMDAAEKSIFLPDGVAAFATPSSDRGLVKMVGGDGNTVLLVNDEFRSVLGKCQIPNSTLAQVFCTLWSKDKSGVADKKALDNCIGKLCILGNIAAEDPADFAKVFGNNTTTGMYDRFIFGYDTAIVNFRPLTGIKTEFFTEMVVKLPNWIWDKKDKWGSAVEGRNRRLPEHALRIALINAAINGDKEVTVPCMAAAFRMVELQERVRAKFKPGLAETKEAECLEAIYAALLDQTKKQQRTNTFPKGADKCGYSAEVAVKYLNF